MAALRTDYSSLDDRTLVVLIGQGQSQALSELYERYSRLVFTQAVNIVRNRSAAEEITQEVFIRIWENARTYRAHQSAVSTWLTSITRNRSIDILRQRRSRPESHSVEWAEMPPNDEHVADSYERTMDIQIQRKRVRTALGQLPADQQKALSLAYFAGYTHRVAEALEEPLGTVKTRIRLGMQKLRRLLEKE